MASDQPSRRKTYIIPDNFIDEGRIINGMFRTRYFVEAVILAVFAAMFALLIPVEKVTNKITLVVFIAGPFFALGITGISGDPLSVAAKNVFHWVKTRSLMLYDSNPRALVTTPLDKMMNQTLRSLPEKDFSAFLCSRSWPEDPVACEEWLKAPHSTEG